MVAEKMHIKEHRKKHMRVSTSLLDWQDQENTIDLILFDLSTYVHERGHV